MKPVVLIEAPVVHTTKDGTQYIDSKELLGSRVGRAALNRLRSAKIVASSQCVPPAKKASNDRRSQKERRSSAPRKLQD